MELFKKYNVYNGKDGVEHKGYNFYIRLDSGNYVSIKCAFKEDYRVLVAISKDL